MVWELHWQVSFRITGFDNGNLVSRRYPPISEPPTWCLCDSVAFEKVKHPKRVLHQLVVPSSIEYVLTAMESYQKR